MIPKILILGSTGFIGTNLINKLADINVNIVSFSTSIKSPLKHIEHINGDIRDTEKVNKLLRFKPDIIFCLLGLSGQVASEENSMEYFSVNVIAIMSLLQIILKIVPESKFIFSSSRLEYGIPQYLPVDEKHPTLPLCNYGFQKNIITRYCQFLYSKYNLKTTVLRTSNPFGPQNTTTTNYNVINFFIKSVLNNKKIIIYGHGNQMRDYFYIDDLIDVMIRIAFSIKTAGQIYNLGMGKGISQVEVAKEIIRQAGKGQIKFIRWPKKAKSVETGDYISDISKIYNELKWKPSTSLVTGIKKTIAYL